MATSNQDTASQSIFVLSDAWFVVSEYMTHGDIASLSVVNKEANAWINQSAVWEQQCDRFFDLPAPLDNSNEHQNKTSHRHRFKEHFKTRIELYGKDSIQYYKRVLECWNAFHDWCTCHLPEMLRTFNEPATRSQIHELKHMICSEDMIARNHYKHVTPYLILLGQCCNGQNRSAPRMGMYGYYSFYHKASSGHLLSISDAIKYTAQAHKVYACGLDKDRHQQLRQLWLFCAGIPTMDRMITIPCLTFMNRSDGTICKITQDAQMVQLKHGESHSFIQHLEFYILRNVVANNYRVNREFGILRYPLTDVATSESMTKGIVCRGSPLFIPEISNIKHNNYLFAYHIEIECPSSYHDDTEIQMKQRCKECPNESYQLTVRKWCIQDCDGEIERVEGPGVIGLYPKVCVDQELFHYESCSQQSQPANGKMWGCFLFKQSRNEDDAPTQDTFELEVAPYQLDWNLCQWI